MTQPNDEQLHRVRRQRIDLDHAERKYASAREAYRYGARRIVASAR